VGDPLLFALVLGIEPAIRRTSQPAGSRTENKVHASTLKFHSIPWPREDTKRRWKAPEDDLPLGTRHRRNEHDILHLPRCLEFHVGREQLRAVPDNFVRLWTYHVDGEPDYGYVAVDFLNEHRSTSCIGVVTASGFANTTFHALDAYGSTGKVRVYYWRTLSHLGRQNPCRPQSTPFRQNFPDSISFFHCPYPS
jgi:hypothetical protein